MKITIALDAEVQIFHRQGGVRRVTFPVRLVGSVEMDEARAEIIGSALSVGNVSVQRGSMIARSDVYAYMDLPKELLSRILKTSTDDRATAAPVGAGNQRASSITLTTESPSPEADGT